MTVLFLKPQPRRHVIAASPSPLHAELWRRASAAPPPFRSQICRRTEGYFGFPLFWFSCKRSFSDTSPRWKGPSCLTRYVTGYTSCSSLRSSWGGISSSTGARLSQRKSSSTVLVAAHVLGRSHRSHAELAYSFSTVFKHLTWLLHWTW